jgi:hypothetical protein
MNILLKLLFTLLLAFGSPLPTISSALSLNSTLFGYDGQNEAKMTYDEASFSAFNYDAAAVRTANKKENRSVGTDGVFGHFVELLAAKSAQGLLNPGINATEKGMRHVLERHIVNGIPEFAGKRKFATGVNIRELIQQGTQTPMVRQANGNFARTFDAGRAIGIERASGQATSTVTIITAPNGNLITMFPGVP